MLPGENGNEESTQYRPDQQSLSQAETAAHTHGVEIWLPRRAVK
jgi:hypothetical protein